MSIPNSLIQMPNVVKEHILEHLDFPSILILRKVCHDLRNFIDVTKPECRLTKIQVSATSESISCNLYLPSYIRIEYQKNGDGCLVKCEKEGNVKETILEDEDFAIYFFKDFDIVLSHQKTVLEKFSISCFFLDPTVKSSIMESVSKSLKSMNKPLQAKSLRMTVNNTDNILTVLPYVDPKSLELIEISGRVGGGNVVINLDEFGQLEQWKQAKELLIQEFQLSGLAQNLKHFSKITFCYRPISTEELILLKEIFLCSAALNIIKFYHDFEYTENKPKLIEAFGQPFVVGNNDEDHDEDDSWFFRIPNSNQFRIKSDMLSIYFNRIEQSDVPQTARISS